MNYETARSRLKATCATVLETIAHDEEFDQDDAVEWWKDLDARQAFIELVLATHENKTALLRIYQEMLSKMREAGVETETIERELDD